MLSHISVYTGAFAQALELSFTCCNLFAEKEICIWLENDLHSETIVKALLMMSVTANIVMRTWTLQRLHQSTQVNLTKV